MGARSGGNANTSVAQFGGRADSISASLNTGAGTADSIYRACNSADGRARSKLAVGIRANDGAVRASHNGQRASNRFARDGEGRAGAGLASSADGASSTGRGATNTAAIQVTGRGSRAVGGRACGSGTGSKVAVQRRDARDVFSGGALLNVSGANRLNASAKSRIAGGRRDTGDSSTEVAADTIGTGKSRRARSLGGGASQRRALAVDARGTSVATDGSARISDAEVTETHLPAGTIGRGSAASLAGTCEGSTGSR